MSTWRFDRDAMGQAVVVHQVSPRFTVYWTSGEKAAIVGPCWSDPGSGSGEDGLHLFGVQWLDQAPHEAEVKRLMHAATRAIDAWIAGRL